MRLRLQKFFQFIARKAKEHLLWVIFLSLVSIWVTAAYFEFLFESPLKDANIKTFPDALWWGIVTFLTVGYGDKYPISTEGRFFASFLMLAGVAAVGVLTAKISSYFLEQALKKGRGDVDTQQLNNHFVVCGWTDDMDELLVHILDFNSHLKSSQLVLIANISLPVRDALHANPRLKELGVIVGDYFTEVNLRRAAPERARKVLILADRTPGHTGQTPTLTEVDARTIMTAMSLSNLARGTLVAAEILDPKMDQYLKIAGVSEIIYSREYSRLLLGNASGGTGVVNILYDLLDPKTPATITTHPMPPTFVRKTYKEMKTDYEHQNRGSVVIGILENFGNQHIIKESALRKAQQTSDVGRLVANLQAVKDLRCNAPIFNPPDGYLIPEGSMIILIETRTQRGTHVVDRTSHRTAA